MSRKKETLSREFSLLLGISHSAISDIEGGKREMSISELVAYQKICNCSYDHLFGSKTKSPDADIQGICKKTGLSEKTVNELILYAEHQKNSTPFSNYINVIDNTFQLIMEGYSKSVLYNLVRFEAISEKILEEKQKACDNASEIQMTFYGTYNGLDEIINSDVYRNLIDKQDAVLFNIQRKFANKLEDQFKEKSNEIDLKFSKKVSDYNSKTTEKTNKK